MKRPFIIVALCNLIVVLAAIGYAWIVNKELVLNGAAIGLTLMPLSAINFVAGIIVITAPRKDKTVKNHYGRSMLLFSAIMFLCSFTLCTYGLLH